MTEQFDILTKDYCYITICSKTYELELYQYRTMETDDYLFGVDVTSADMAGCFGFAPRDHQNRMRLVENATYREADKEYRALRTMFLGRTPQPQL